MAAIGKRPDSQGKVRDIYDCGDALLMDASRERESGGLGVGLSVTKEIIDRHHGYIAVESELNHGTKFTLHIPRDQGKSQSQSQPAQDAK